VSLLVRRRVEHANTPSQLRRILPKPSARQRLRRLCAPPSTAVPFRSEHGDESLGGVGVGGVDDDRRRWRAPSAAPRELMAGGSIWGEKDDGTDATSTTVLADRQATRSPLATNLSKIA
jgi:hypothetical protein